MNKAVLSALAGTAPWEARYPFDLVITYEDPPTRQRALHLYDRLAQQLLDEYDFQCAWWKADRLLNPALCQQAAEAAARAQMIILSVRADQPLSAAIQGWLQRWLHLRGSHKTALVALLNSSGRGPEQVPRLRAQLQQLARQARADFFAHTYELAEEPAADPPVPAAVSDPVLDPLLEEFLPEPVYTPRWGINE